MNWLDMFQAHEHSFMDEYARLYGSIPRTVTFIVTEACNLRCTYCYQHNKSTRVMPFEVAKKCVDTLFAEDAAHSEYINDEEANGIILDFIGGEPLLEIDLIDQIVDYFLNRAVELNHRWAVKYMISMSTNGTLYFENNVQRFVKKHDGRVSIGVTIDGDKELHDMCRLYPDGRGSYDDAAAAFDELLHEYNQTGTKLTLAPGNISYLAGAARNMFERFGISDLHANCVFEEGWDYSHAKVMYDQLKELADWLLDNDFEAKHHISLFDYTKYRPMSRDDDQNWCFKPGTPVLTTKGAKPIEDIDIGDMVINKYGHMHPVEGIHKHFSFDCCKLTFEDGRKLHTTYGHKFWAKQRLTDGSYSEPGWFAIKDLRLGDVVCTPCLGFGSDSIDADYANYIGRNCSEHMPECIHSLSRATADEIFWGYVYAHTTEHVAGHRRVYAPNLCMATELFELALEFGYSAALEESKLDDSYSLIVYDIVYDPDDDFEIDTQTDGESNAAWTRIAYIGDDMPGIVYNITVEDEHEYIACGVSVANCGGTGKMLAFGVDGVIYPCLRYAPASLGPDVKPLVVGHADHGIERTDEEKETTAMLRAITRSSQSTDECMNCPIAQGCAWCSAYNYERFGTPNRRATFICCMHKATSLANVYYWNKLLRKYGEDMRIHMYLPKEEALKIIDEDEYNMLDKLASEG